MVKDQNLLIEFFKDTRFVVAVLGLLTGFFLFPASVCLSGETIPDQPDPFSGKRISGISVQIRDYTEDLDLWESRAKDLIPIQVDDVYSIRQIELAITRLVDSNLFQSVHVDDPVPDDNGIHLNFSLTPFGRIKDIVIHHAFPLYDREIINIMTFDVGDAFVFEKLAGQEERIETLYKSQGYPEPHVKVTAEKDETDQNSVVSIDIEKGWFYRINTVKFIGNHHFSSLRLKLRIDTWKSSVLFGNARRFIEKALEEDLKNIRGFYHRKGFADSRIEPEILKDELRKTVDIVFHVDEGPLYDISFQGNEAFWDYSLKKEVMIFKGGNKNDAALKKTARNLKEKYTKGGYPDADIDRTIVEDDSVTPPLKKVSFDIQEGNQYRVSRLDIQGNHAVSTPEILDSMLTGKAWIAGLSGIYRASVLDEDIRAIQALYHQNGYMDIRVEKKVQIQDEMPSGPAKQNAVDIRIMIDEGIQTRVHTVEFEGLTVIAPEGALSVLKLIPGTPFDEVLIPADEKILQQKISEKGYPHATVRAMTDFFPDKSGATIRYQIQEGPRVTMGQVFYTGNFRTRTDVLDTEMELSTGRPFLLSGLLESRKNLLDVNALDSVRFRTIGLKTMEDEVDLVVEVSEKKPYFFEIGAGYDTERHFYLSSLIGDHNFMGRNMQVQTGGEISQIGYKADIVWASPRVFSWRIASSTRLFAEDREEFNKDFGTSSFGASQDFSKSFLDKKLTTHLGVVYEYREQYLTGNRPVLDTGDEIDRPRSILVASPGVIWQTTDSFVRPRKGVFSSVHLDFSKGMGSHLDDFVKYRLDARYYYTPAEPLTLAVRGRYGFIQPYGGNSSVPEDQLFFLGGTSTVRGFDENLLRFDVNGQAVGGRQIMLGSLEARYDLGMNLELTAFYDIGRVSDTQDRSNLESFRDAVGIGLRYMTPIGPIGILYGWKLDPMPGESPGCFHFSMGYTF